MRHVSTYTRVRLTIAALAAAAATGSFASAGILRVDRVAAGGVDTWTFRTTAGAHRAVVEGDGDSDLDCYVYDSGGSLLGSDDDRSDYCVVEFHTARAEAIRLKIKNRGKGDNKYTLRFD